MSFIPLLAENLAVTEISKQIILEISSLYNSESLTAFLSKASYSLESFCRVDSEKLSQHSIFSLEFAI